MPVDPELQPFLELVNAAQVPVRDLGAEGLRENFSGMASMFGAGPEVREITDRTIPGPAGEIPIRIYRPLERSANPPGVVVFFHGGGFVIGDLESHDSTCRLLANGAGAVVVAVDYRLAPEHPFPAAPDDCLAALRWVHDSADELEVDASRIAVAGDSAGGNLAAVMAQHAKTEDIPVVFQLLIYPVVDVDETADRYGSRSANAEGYFLTQETMEWFGECYVTDPSFVDDVRASPIRCADLSGLAPALVITAEYDPLCDEGEAYAKALADAGVDVTLTRYDGAIHGFFQMPSLTSVAQKANDEAAAALRAHLT
ncbi:MAG: alpha/beta hydrolase [Acidimicrobiales bacterium]